MKFISPLITVSDIARSRKFYEDILNQKVKFDFGANVTFHGDFSIHLDSHFAQLIDNKEIITYNHSFELYFEHDNLEEITEKLIKNHVRIIHPLREQPWRQKVIRFYDPDGHIVEVGESMEHLCARLASEGLGIEDITKATGLPADFVKSALK